MLTEFTAWKSEHLRNCVNSHTQLCSPLTNPTSFLFLAIGDYVFHPTTAPFFIILHFFILPLHPCQSS